MKARILMIHPNFYVYGGAERQIVYLANYLTEHNYPVSIMSTRFCNEMRRDLKEARIIVMPDYQNMSRIATMIANKFNIINPHNHPAELMTIPSKIPIVWQMNEPPIEVLSGGDINKQEKTIVKRFVTRGVVISHFEKKRFKETYGFEPTVNHPGITYFPEFTKDYPKPKDKFNLKDNFVILQAGYYTFTKNQLKTVEIFNEIKDDIKNAKLVLVGYDKDPYKYKVDQKILELGLQEDVLTLGFLKDDREFRDLYHMANIHIAPVMEQGGWMTHLQALITGKPAIISDRFTAVKLAKDNNLGVVTKIENFPKEIINVYNNYEKAQKQSEKAGKWIRKNLSWKKYGERYSKIFDEVWIDEGEMGAYEY